MRRSTKLKERGVTFDIEKTETPVCWMAQFRDPDGNKLVIHKRKNMTKPNDEYRRNDQIPKPEITSDTHHGAFLSFGLRH